MTASIFRVGLTALATFAAFVLLTFVGAPVAKAQETGGCTGRSFCLPGETIHPVGGRIMTDDGGWEALNQTYLGMLSPHAIGELCDTDHPDGPFCSVRRWDSHEDEADACGGGGANAGTHGQLDGKGVCKRHVAGGGQGWWLETAPGSGEFDYITPTSNP